MIGNGIIGNGIRRTFVLAGLKAKEKTTLKNYFCQYKKWKNYADSEGIVPLPTSSELVGEFLILSVERNSLQVIKQVMAGINYFHRLFGFEVPCGEFHGGLVNDYINKHTKKPCRNIEPILISHIEKVFNCFDFEKCSLYFLRSLGILIIGFFGFLRFGEMRNLLTSDICFEQDCVKICIRNSKTDKLRKGQYVRFDNGSFPAKFLVMYFRRFQFVVGNDEKNVLFMSMKKDSKGRALIHLKEKMSYNSFSRVLKQLFDMAGIPSKYFRLHSLRIGGASEASRLGVPDFKVGVNGRWQSDRSRILYQRDPAIGPDSVSRVLSDGFRSSRVFR